MNAFKVLHGDVTGDEYRCAVATIINDILRAKKGETLISIAEAVDCSLGTISNAFNKKADLNATYLARIGKHYGGGFLNPYLALFGAQAAPIEPKPAVDVLPLVAKVNLKLAEAGSPQGPGGVVHVPQEKLGYLPDLKEMQREVGCLISDIERAHA